MPDEHSGWKFSQCFGDKGHADDITEADIISAVEFDETGRYLATGDRGGRVVLFEREDNKKGCQYRFWTEFQSHDPEFDYLKSIEIEEKINKIRWCKRSNSAHFLLSTNDKTIKLWKIHNKKLKSVVPSYEDDADTYDQEEIDGGAGTGHYNVPPRGLRLPRMMLHDTVHTHVPRRVFANGHAYHINSIALNSDNETFLSADDLRINLWNLEISDQSFNIVDIKPPNMEDLTEVITSADFHPQSCNIFAYSSSKGVNRLADMRQRALCDTAAKVFYVDDDLTDKSFFSEIITSISDVRFSPDGRYLASRDYLTLKIWDINMDREPIKTIHIHEHLRPKLCDLYEGDCIFDKFECIFNGDSQKCLTGSYNNNFHIYDIHGNGEVMLEASKNAFRKKQSLSRSRLGIRKRRDDLSPSSGGQNSPPENLDITKRILHAAWHPRENSIAVAATNNLFIFSQL
ncbi:protein phosphatase PP2A regulatory subunit B [Fonticula alba]|uniref:Serine/threonine-protein phosphatase 2A 55 kDa regulatory subunit B n=1 Tax=Fonticula alba TaxID=691883 RepID=A0A058ZE58_FONAL|nr:protein phosphatase PP2A regulatory subunit B [Fonticula alba]KCV72208.1 protein phosphatase PP2A regulatory subunit B [Fonticula alba]|eukprot:XP_009493786.1 protein phosphatase PP2A regulatory subunit B [Fonticula alba]